MVGGMWEIPLPARPRTTGCHQPKRKNLLTMSSIPSLSLFSFIPWSVDRWAWAVSEFFPQMFVLHQFLYLHEVQSGPVDDAVNPYRGSSSSVIFAFHCSVQNSPDKSTVNPGSICFNAFEQCGLQGRAVGVSPLKETPTPGPVCFIWTYVLFCCSVFDFSAIYFTTKTLFVHDCAPFIERI